MDQQKSRKLHYIYSYLISVKESVFALLKAHKAVFVGLSEVNLHDLTRAHFNKLRNWLTVDRLAELTPAKRNRYFAERKKKQKEIKKSFATKLFE